MVLDFANYAEENKFEHPIDWLLFLYMDRFIESSSLFPHETVPNLAQHMGDISTFAVRSD